MKKYFCISFILYGTLTYNWLKGHENEKAGLRQLKWVTERENSVGTETAEAQGTVYTGSTGVTELAGDTTEGSASDWTGNTRDPWRLVLTPEAKFTTRQWLRRVQAAFTRSQLQQIICAPGLEETGFPSKILLLKEWLRPQFMCTGSPQEAPSCTATPHVHSPGKTYLCLR